MTTEVAANPTDIKRRVRKDVERREERERRLLKVGSDLRQVARTEPGRAVLWHQLERLFLPLHDSNGLILAANAGEHDAAARLWNRLRAQAPDELLLLLREHLPTT